MDILFNIYNISIVLLYLNLLLLKLVVQIATLVNYLGTLSRILYRIITYSACVSYIDKKVHIISKNLILVSKAPQVIKVQLAKDLTLGCADVYNGQSLFITLLLGLVLKVDSSQQRIYYLSFPKATSVNDNIPAAQGKIRYTIIKAIVAHIQNAGKGVIILKKDLKNAFQLIPVAVLDQQLLGFKQQG